ncbi:hypothetical protein BpHYR1_032455 [Brachionus plicatilis]|uniref:Uncharacterized protein n=1 Tax=Brachionus plicatilis TaxID=10195 RepID=A0A3M7SUH1_BRAPC|nr:hypothetical protein BpHYR1_032455 [Brachionus plicatilis]
MINICHVKLAWKWALIHFSTRAHILLKTQLKIKCGLRIKTWFSAALSVQIDAELTQKKVFKQIKNLQQLNT